MAEAGEARNQFGMVRINHAELLRKLHRRGKTPSALRAAKVASFDTLAKIAQGKPVKAEILHRITVQLAEWPELEHAADLLEQPA